MFAVREEVELLRAKIVELESTVSSRLVTNFMVPNPRRIPYTL